MHYIAPHLTICRCCKPHKPPQELTSAVSCCRQKDGGLVKKILTKGEGWESPESGDEVTGDCSCTTEMRALAPCVGRHKCTNNNPLRPADSQSSWRSALCRHAGGWLRV